MFMNHFDSRFRWGEAIIGVSLGQASNIYFTRPGRATVTVPLPRRSIYCMTGECRLAWRHGIAKQDTKKLPAPPSWNPFNMRRSLTLRAQKAYSDAFLQHLLAENNNNNTNNHGRLAAAAAATANIAARIQQQNKFKPRLGQNKLNPQELTKERAHGAQ
jgi:hypothetical protein